jgi:hypothetical protein
MSQLATVALRRGASSRPELDLSALTPPETLAPEPTPPDLEAPEQAIAEAPEVPAAEEASSEVPATCPRCQGKLTDPKGLGWCQTCGYCRSLEEDRGAVVLPAKAAPAARSMSLFGLVETGQMLAMLPGWVWVMISGAGVVVGLSFGVNHLMLQNGLSREVWGTVLVGVGALTVFLAHVAALVAIAPHDDRLSGKDLFFPARLWTMTLKRLPATRWHLCIWIWGLSLLLSAKFIMGGLPINIRPIKPKEESRAPCPVLPAGEGLWSKGPTTHFPT